MPTNNTVLPLRLLLSIVLISIFYACSSPQATMDRDPSQSGQKTISFDPAWHNPLSPVTIDSAAISVSELVLASDSLKATILAVEQASLALHEATDNYAEKMRINSATERTWGASDLIKFRRFVLDYVKTNQVEQRVKASPAENGYYCWKELSLDRPKLDEALKQNFGL